MIILYRTDASDEDRWVSFDRFPRKLYRKIRGGTARLTGQNKAFYNTCLGLKKIGIRYSLNPPNEVIATSKYPVLLFGQSNVAKIIDRHPGISFIVGPALYSHPIENPRLAEYENVKFILVPGKWMEDMCRPYWGDKVIAWPVGIDIDEWALTKQKESRVDFLIYDKIMWRDSLNYLQTIRVILDKHSLTYEIIKYGHYDEKSYKKSLARCKAMIYLCEHETQGIAYQQALATGTPILAWDQGDYWLDPRFYPLRVKYKPVSSVPYWDEKCGVCFSDIKDFESRLTQFLIDMKHNSYDPRGFITKNLTLDHSASSLMKMYNEVANLAN